MPIEIITKDDLQNFRKQLLNDFKELLAISQKERIFKAWFRSGEVRKMLDISDGTLQNLRVTGKLPSSKIGGIHYYRLSDVEKLLESNLER
ncbi:MAG TPA: helix-turn-helix domain-containing protein [Parafilimonas sp.]|nr:helix-turn-helix domain-containing protein [Parafilimonas sp.]